MRSFRLLAATTVLAAWATACGAQSPAALVNPLIGTANGGNTFPGAVVPFGMVQFSPEESPDPKNQRPSPPRAATSTTSIASAASA